MQTKSTIKEQFQFLDKESQKYYEDAFSKEEFANNRIVLRILYPHIHKNALLKLAFVILIPASLYLSNANLLQITLITLSLILATVIGSVISGRRKTINDPEFRSYVDNNGKDYNNLPFKSFKSKTSYTLK